MSFYVAFWAYAGLESAINVIEEIKEPVTKNVVTSIIISNSVIIVM